MTRLLMAGQLASYRGADSDDGRFLRSTTQPAASIRSSQARRSSWSHAGGAVQGPDPMARRPNRVQSGHGHRSDSRSPVPHSGQWLTAAGS